MLISAKVASDILPSTILERSVLVYLQLLQCSTKDLGSKPEPLCFAW